MKPAAGEGDLLVRQVGRLLTMRGPDGTGLVRDASVLVRGGRIAWTGPERQLPAGSVPPACPELDAGGACVLPGFVDPHTHLIWAGTRREELAARLAGRPYDGGGIHTTVAATRSATDADLASAVRGRLSAMLAHGTTTVEVKTGYGLEPAEELRQLDIARDCADEARQSVEITYLVHVPPPGVDRADHVEATAVALPEAARRGARWCDVFCDDGAFTIAETHRLMEAARSTGLGLRMHADQLHCTGAAVLAASLGCASADHLERVDESGIRALAAAGTTAVLLPTATLATRGQVWAPARALLDAGVTIALGTDSNPGTSWCESMPYAVQMACLTLGLSVDEALRAATRGSAGALRRHDIGRIETAARGDLAVLASDHEADLVGHLGAAAVAHTVTAGVLAAAQDD